MAKRGILEHPKLSALAEALNLDDCFAVGVLETFWHLVARTRPDGDLTGVSPRWLATGIHYSRDPHHLWRALVDTGFIDVLPDGRRMVHDWSEHADNSTHQLLKKRGQPFADGSLPFSRTREPAVNGSQTVHELFMNDSQTVHDSFTSRVMPARSASSQLPCIASATTTAGAPAREEPKPPEPEPPEPESPLAGNEPWRSAALRLYHEHEAAIWEFFRTPPVGSQAEEVLTALAFHLAAGRAIGAAEVTAAIAAARQWCRQGNRGKPTAGALVVGLAQVVNPDLELCDDEGDDLERSERSGRANGAAGRPGGNRATDTGGSSGGRGGRGRPREAPDWQAWAADVVPPGHNG